METETHTFHLPVGECTIALEDVVLQLGIRVNSRPITGATYYDWEEMCEQYLTVVPPKGEAIVGFAIKLKATNLDAKTMGGCASLLQSWAWYRMPFIAARVNRTPSYSLVTRCSGGVLSFIGTPQGDVIGYRMRLDHMTAEQNPTQFQAKEEKVKAADDSLSETDWLSEIHPLSEASSSLSGWETLEEDKLEICTPSAQPACPVRTLFLLALSAPMLA
ncbi:Serine/threonine-protein phosphatase 7 long form [Glycine soja]